MYSILVWIFLHDMVGLVMPCHLKFQHIMIFLFQLYDGWKTTDQTGSRHQKMYNIWVWCLELKCWRCILAFHFRNQFNFTFYLCYVMLEGKLTLKGPLQQYHQLSWNQIQLYILCFNVYKVRKRCESKLQSRTAKICYVCYINYMKIVTVYIMTIRVKQSIHKVRNHQAMPLQYERSAGVHPCPILIKANIDLQDAKKPCTWDVIAVQMPQTWKNVPQRLRQFRVHSYLVEGEFRIFFRDGLGAFRVGWRFWLAAPFRSSHQNT